MYHLICNGGVPREKLNKELTIVKQVFNKAGKELKIYITDHAGHAKEIAADLTEGGRFAHLVAMGGDGTLHEVLNGISDIEQCTLGLIPIGSGNDFATTAGLLLDTRFAAASIVFRAPTNIDYIELENGLRSINVVGSGIDVDVLKRAYGSKKKGKHKYLSALLRSIQHYKPTTFKVSWDGGPEEEHSGLMACFGNGKQFGGGIKICPDAKISDGYMDLCVVDYFSRARTIVAFLKLLRGKLNNVKEITHVRCKTATFIPVGDENVPIQAEGEIYENTPLKAHIVEGKLKFYLPKR